MSNKAAIKRLQKCPVSLVFIKIFFTEFLSSYPGADSPRCFIHQCLDRVDQYLKLQVLVNTSCGLLT